MKTIGEQLAALSVLDTLKHAAQPASLTGIPWQVAVGSWSEVSGWSPASFSANLPTNTRSGLYYNAEKKAGDHAVGIKKTTGSLAAVERQLEVWMCSAMGAKPSGYQLAMVSNAIGEVNFVLKVFVEGELKGVLFESGFRAFAENDSFFLAKAGSKLMVYYRSGETTPVLLGAAEDSTFTEGFVGFGGNGSNPKVLNLTVGALTVNTEVKRFRNTVSTNNSVITSIGTCARREDVTLAALVRIPSKPASGFSYSFVNLASTGGAARGFGVRCNEAGRLECEWLESEATTTVSATPSLRLPFDNHWRLIVCRKEVGAKKADFGIYDFQTQEWSWEEGNEGAAVKSEIPSEVWLGSANGLNRWNGSYVAAMIGPVMSRVTAETLPKVNSLIEWRSLANGLWFLNKALVSEKLEDETGNGANQTNTPSGGSVSSEAPPIPYYTPPTIWSRVLVGATVKFVKRWILAAGAVRRG